MWARINTACKSPPGYRPNYYRIGVIPKTPRPLGNCGDHTKCTSTGGSSNG